MRGERGTGTVFVVSECINENWQSLPDTFWRQSDATQNQFGMLARRLKWPSEFALHPENGPHRAKYGKQVRRFCGIVGSVIGLLLV